MPEPDDATPVPETGGTLTVDLGAIEANWRTLSHPARHRSNARPWSRRTPTGVGLEPVTTALAKAGCKTFFVADIAEARRVRARARDAVIYVLNGLAPHSAPAFAEASLRPVINGTGGACRVGRLRGLDAIGVAARRCTSIPA